MSAFAICVSLSSIDAIWFFRASVVGSIILTRRSAIRTLDDSQLVLLAYRRERCQFKPVPTALNACRDCHFCLLHFLGSLAGFAGTGRVPALFADRIKQKLGPWDLLLSDSRHGPRNNFETNAKPFFAWHENAPIPTVNIVT